MRCYIIDGRYYMLLCHIYYKHNISDIFAYFILNSWFYATIKFSRNDRDWSLLNAITHKNSFGLSSKILILRTLLYYTVVPSAYTMTKWRAHTVTYYDKYWRKQSGEISSLRWWSISAIAITFRYDFPRLSRSVSRRTRAWPPGERNTSSWTDRYFSFPF